MMAMMSTVTRIPLRCPSETFLIKPPDTSFAPVVLLLCDVSFYFAFALRCVQISILL